jgi:cytochrome c oxidase subunit 3
LSTATATDTLATYRWHTSLNRMGLWLFIASEVFMFGALFVTRFYLWGNTRPHLDQQFGLLITVILLISSVSMNRAETAIAHDDRRTFMRWLLATTALGLIFLGGVVGIEWRGHIRPSDGAYGAVLYMMTGIHALLILMIWYLARKGSFSAERHWGVEATAVYWHFVDVVWVFFYPALYLFGTAAGHG